MSEPLLTSKEVAAWLKVSTNWVHRHASGYRRPLLPSLKVGASRRFRACDVEEFLKLCAVMARDMAKTRSIQ